MSRYFRILLANAIFVLALSSPALAQSELSLEPPPPVTLRAVDVGAQAVNCIFASNCQLTVTDTVANIPLPPAASGIGRLQTRIFTGTAGSPGAGKTAYLYSVDMSQAVTLPEVASCVTDMTLDFGPVSKLQYGGSSDADDVFVVSVEGIDTVGLYEAVQTGKSITFTFNQPVCAGTKPGTGVISNFIGVASSSAPRSVAVALGWTGALPLKVEARAPNL